MIMYKVFYKGEEFQQNDLIGVLAERRKDLRGKTQFEAGLKWAKFFFTGLIKDRQAIFVEPNEFEARD
jgi:hypothetical protein